jgi:hypothetical protein
MATCALMLTSCVSSTVSVKTAERQALPPIPARLGGCFKTLTKIPIKDMTKREVAQLVARIRASEVRMSRCGRDIIQWYGGVRKDFGPQPQKKPWLSIGR